MDAENVTDTLALALGLKSFLIGSLFFTLLLTASGHRPWAFVVEGPWGNHGWECKNDGKDIPTHGCPRFGLGLPLPWTLCWQCPSGNVFPADF